MNIRKLALLKELREIEKEKSLKQKRMNANLYQDNRRVIIADTKKETEIRAVETQTATIQKPIPIMLTNNTPDNICLLNINIQDMTNIKDILTESLSPVVKAIESNTKQIKTLHVQNGRQKPGFCTNLKLGTKIFRWKNTCKLWVPFFKILPSLRIQNGHYVKNNQLLPITGRC